MYTIIYSFRSSNYFGPGIYNYFKNGRHCHHRN